MSTKVKDRLRRMLLELDQEGRTLLDRALEHFSGRTCDEAIEMLSDEKVREIVGKIKERKKKKEKKKEMLVEV